MLPFLSQSSQINGTEFSMFVRNWSMSKSKQLPFLMITANCPLLSCTFVHFRNDVFASVRYHTRGNAQIDGQRATISPSFENGRPVHYAQRPLLFPCRRSTPPPQQLQQQEQQQQHEGHEVDLFEDFSPSPSPPPSAVSPPPSLPPSSRQQQQQQQQQLSSLQQQQHHAFNGMIRKNLQEIDGMVLAYREEIEKLLERKQRLEELLLE
ncbi:hypothetical protein BDF20DRAFT_922531 [Mycotypha africana]|uniref:uncharacterized protein n=1 Tax=Mycotypha africana TaxID=64632 RepID=UPI00230072E1|nr:uncharacterized protein BDF20DRAFT_922531 [Mycotypha africana]KAI8970033.1 hypothetical protein BDF20DRAFT_922531 [Mycotypha africana]